MHSIHSIHWIQSMIHSIHSIYSIHWIQFIQFIQFNSFNSLDSIHWIHSLTRVRAWLFDSRSSRCNSRRCIDTASYSSSFLPNTRDRPVAYFPSAPFQSSHPGPNPPSFHDSPFSHCQKLDGSSSSAQAKTRDPRNLRLLRLAPPLLRVIPAPNNHPSSPQPPSLSLSAERSTDTATSLPRERTSNSGSSSDSRARSRRRREANRRHLRRCSRFRPIPVKIEHQGYVLNQPLVQNAIDGV